MSKGINKDGSPKKRPVNSGRKPKTGAVSFTFKLAADVAAKIKEQPNQTAFVEKAVRNAD